MYFFLDETTTTTLDPDPRWDGRVGKLRGCGPTGSLSGACLSGLSSPPCGIGQSPKSRILYPLIQTSAQNRPLAGCEVGGIQALQAPSHPLPTPLLHPQTRGSGVRPGVPTLVSQRSGALPDLSFHPSTPSPPLLGLSVLPPLSTTPGVAIHHVYNM